jgi:hypothetical protein
LSPDREIKWSARRCRDLSCDIFVNEEERMFAISTIVGLHEGTNGAVEAIPLGPRHDIDWRTLTISQPSTGRSVQLHPFDEFSSIYVARNPGGVVTIEP